METYSYCTVTVDVSELGKEAFTERLNRMGIEGWKLASTVSHERHGYSHEVHLVFLRPRAALASSAVE